MHTQRTISNIYSLDRRPSFFLMLATTLGYVLLGSAGLVLAIPPGYASPVFPAAGLSIALTLYFGPIILPAIWFSSLMLNLGVALIHGSLSTTCVWVAVGIATGSVMQALCARLLVQYRLGKKWRVLESERDIIHFLLIAGPMACIISASVGTACLVVSGLVDTGEWSFGWWNWYVGDTLGVLLFTPLTIGWIHRKKISWSSRLRTITVPTIVMLIVASTTFLYVSHWEQVNLNKDIKAHGEKLTHLLNNHIVALQEILTSMASFIEVTPNMTLTQFNQFTHSVLKTHADIAALSFNLLLTDAQRQRFENDLAQRYAVKVPQIMERNTGAALAPAPHRAEYVAVAFISPFQENSKAIGFNINSEQLRHDAIQRSRQTGRPTATAQINLVQAQKNKPGILVLTPVKFNEGIQNIVQTDKSLDGFAVAVIKVDELIEIATQGMIPAGIELEITDPSAAPEDRLLYSSQNTMDKTSPPLNWQTSISIADRQWNLSVFPNAIYLQQNRPILAWFTGVVGLLLTSMLQIILLGVTGRNNLIQRRVDNQTAQLGEKNAKLAQSEARYASVVNNVKEVVFQTDAQGLWTFLNPAWTEVTGFPVNTSLGTLFLNYVHPDDRQKNQERFTPLIERKKDYCRHEVRYLHKNGSFRWIEVFARLTLDDNNNIIGTSGTLTDITERKQSNLRLQLAATAFTHSREGIMITQPDTTIFDVNDAFTAITGYSRNEVFGQTPRILKSGLHEKSFYTSLWYELDKNGEWHGEIWNRRKNGEVYVEMLSISKVMSSDGELQNYIGLFSDITLLKNRQEQLEYIAHYDPLTHLPNRLLLADRLNQAMAQTLRRNLGLFVVYIDLDGFKQINDQFGHATGDQILKGVATNMEQVLREGDTLSRIGGDEFVSIMLDLKDIDSSLHLLKRLLVAAAQPIQVDDHIHHVSASIGATFYPQNNKVTAEQLLSQADQVMYQAKMAGKNQYKVFEYQISENIF